MMETPLFPSVDGGTGTGPENDLAWQSRVIESGGRYAGCLSAWQARGWTYTRGNARSPPRPTPRPKAHAAEFCQHEAESRAEPEQQSGQDIFSAGRARVRGRMGEGLASDCTSRLYPASLLLLAPNLGKIKDHPGEPLEGLGLPERRASCSTGTRPSIPRRLPPFSSSLCSRSPGSAARPRAGALRAEAARAAVRGRRRQEGRRGEEGGAGAGAALLRKQRERGSWA